MEIQPKDTSRGHFYVSIVKSILRLGACYALWAAGVISDDIAGVALQYAAFALGAAEVLGIVEEIV